MKIKLIKDLKDYLYDDIQKLYKYIINNHCNIDYNEQSILRIINDKIQINFPMLHTNILLLVHIIDNELIVNLKINDTIIINNNNESYICIKEYDNKSIFYDIDNDVFKLIRYIDNQYIKEELDEYEIDITDIINNIKNKDNEYKTYLRNKFKVY